MKDSVFVWLSVLTMALSCATGCHSHEDLDPPQDLLWLGLWVFAVGLMLWLAGIADNKIRVARKMRRSKPSKTGGPGDVE